MRHEESKIQRACVAWFRYQYPNLASLLFAVPNGGARGAVEAAIMKGEGVTPGVADLLFLYPKGEHHGLCIEMKTQSKSSRQSPSQKRWQQEVEKQGYLYKVCRSVDDFIETINNYINTKHNDNDKG